MEHKHRWCASCALVLSRQLIDRTGEGRLVLGNGEAYSHLRIAAVSGRLLVLAPQWSGLMGQIVEEGDVAVQLEVVDHEHDETTMHLFGWLQHAGGLGQAGLADGFAERHLTTDLLDLGISWGLLQLEVAEAHLDCHGNTMVLDAEQLDVAMSLEWRA